MAAKADNRIQSRVPLYHKWVIEQLEAQGFGRNPSDVIARIIGEWVTDREEWLRTRKLTYDRFTTGQASVAGPAEFPSEDTAAGVVLSYPKERVQDDER